MDIQLNPTQVQQDKLSTVLEIPIPHEYKLHESRRRIPGHILFGWNPNNGEIKRIDYQHSSIELDPKGKSIIRYRVNQNKELFYLQALNEKNAKKRVLKIIALIRNQKS